MSWMREVVWILSKTFACAEGRVERGRSRGPRGPRGMWHEATCGAGRWRSNSEGVFAPAFWVQCDYNVALERLGVGADVLGEAEQLGHALGVFVPSDGIDVS